MAPRLLIFSVWPQRGIYHWHDMDALKFAGLAMFDLLMDEEHKLALAEVRGMLSIADARRFRDLLLASAKSARSRFGFFKIIVDTIEAPVQPQDVLAILPGPEDLLINAIDRWALVSGSVLAKVQATRLLNHDQSRVFITREAAMTWIIA